MSHAGIGSARSHLCRTLTMPSSRWLPQRDAGVVPGKLKLGSLVQPGQGAVRSQSQHIFLLALVLRRGYHCHTVLVMQHVHSSGFAK